MKNNIKEIIKNKSLKTTDVINETGLSRSYFYDVMNGNSTPTLTVARKISDAIGKKLDDVFPKFNT